MTWSKETKYKYKKSTTADNINSINNSNTEKVQVPTAIILNFSAYYSKFFEMSYD